MLRFAARSTARIPEACDRWSGTFAVHRFSGNPEVSWLEILSHTCNAVLNVCAPGLIRELSKRVNEERAHLERSTWVTRLVGISRQDESAHMAPCRVVVSLIARTAIQQRVRQTSTSIRISYMMGGSRKARISLLSHFIAVYQSPCQ